MKILQIPLAVDRRSLMPRSRANSRSAIGIRGDKLVMGFVGRMHPQKNFYHFLFLLSQLRPRIDVVGLVVGGPPEYAYANWHSLSLHKERLNQFIKAHHLSEVLCWHPEVKCDEDLSALYSAMDVLFHPTQMLDENFGYVPIEALACGTPVVGTAWGGLKDTLFEGDFEQTYATWCSAGGPRSDLRAAFKLLSRILRAKNDSQFRERCRTHTEKYDLESYARKIQQAVRITSSRTEQPIQRLYFNDLPSRWNGPLEIPDIQVTLEEGASVWSKRRRFSEYYASEKIPAIAGNGRFAYPAPVTGGSGEYRLHDPTWPMRACLSNKHLEATFLMARPCYTVANLAGKQRRVLGSVLREVEQLVQAGLLIPA
jgi:Glycosyl transferases group 1